MRFAAFIYSHRGCRRNDCHQDCADHGHEVYISFECTAIWDNQWSQPHWVGNPDVTGWTGDGPPPAWNLLTDSERANAWDALADATDYEAVQAEFTGESKRGVA